MATYGEGHEAQPWVQPEKDPDAPADDGPSSHETAGQFPADELEGHEAPVWEDGPSSHDTAGEFPADELGNEPAGWEDGPSSSETSGQFPADQVTGETVTPNEPVVPEPEPEPAPEPEPGQ